ncbi:hypothetical protein QVD17_11126 [Tagetes erecta]|uniref:Protein ROOT HAIR DEFECTIVE 3 homolog n=1 Tax=Tagetes erecta TaxID=13708 RepID=A0AAD8P6U4_TARER|nr:hypothetical protein QVD17_11126 [Tagetes erecta]
MSAVCRPHLQTSAGEEVDQTSAVCKKKTVWSKSDSLTKYKQRSHTRTLYLLYVCLLSSYSRKQSEMMTEENKVDGDESVHIKLRVKGNDEEQVVYRIKRNTKLIKLMNAYCNMKSVDFNSIVFLFNGYHLQAEQTPLELDMEDGNQIYAISDDKKAECCSTHLIDGDGTFNAVGLDNFVKQVKLRECGRSYAVVAIMGPQSSGKSTLLNHLFYTNFKEMDAYRGRSQTTKGIWIAKAAGIEPCTIVMDLEGTNGRERGEDDTTFEKQSALFALAVSDIVLINMWCHDIGLEHAGNKPLLKTIFQVMLHLSIPRKTSLVFVIRDKTKTPLENLEPVLWDDIQKIWESILKPEAHKHTPLSEFFHIQVVALSSYEDKEEQFKEQVAGLRQKFFQSITPGGLAGDRKGVVPASGFFFSVQQIWKVIKENQDLDLPAHKVMVATVLCEEIAREKYSSFVANKDWLELQDVQSQLLPSFADKIGSLLYNCLSSYDGEATYYEDNVRFAKRKQLEEQLMQLVQPAYQLMLETIRPKTLEEFKKALNDALNGGLGFAVAARDCAKEFNRLFDEKYVIKQLFWDLEKVRNTFSCDLDSHIAEIRTTKLSELSSRYESKIKDALYAPVEVLLKGGRDDTWPAIRNLLHQETAKAVSEFSFALSGFEIGEQEKEDIISNLESYSRELVEGKAKEEAGKVLYHMKERFTHMIKLDDDLMPRVWTGKEDIQSISKLAQSSSLSLLSTLAVIRLDEETDSIRDTLGLTLMDPKKDNSTRTTLQDPLSSSTWEEVPATKTLITPSECKSLWNQFQEEIEDLITKAIVSQSMDTDESVASSEGESPFAVRSSSCLKKNITWNYVSEGKDKAGRKTLTCNFCHKIFRGGGIYRMKQHLAGAKGDSAVCLKVPKDIRILMKNVLEEVTRKPREKHNLNEVGKINTVQPILGKRKASSTSKNIQSYFQRGIDDPSQPSIKPTLQSKERSHDTDLAIAMWFYDAGIPMSAINSPFFALAMSKIASMGHGYIGPSYHAMRVSLLKDAKQSVKLIVDAYRESWSDTGCTVMGDGWRGSMQRPLINFLVYCPKGISFIKSVDVSGIESNAESLCNLFGEIVEIVGPANVIHMVTENAPNYKAAGRLLCERHPSICWSPCAIHCINLIMKDIGEMPHVADLVTLASRVTVFIYNHKWPLNWLRKRHGWTEIIRPGVTRFGTSFMTLKSLYDHKSDLQAMVNSNEYKVLKLSKAKDVELIILDEAFWENCYITVKVMSPILRLLRICDSSEKPASGYVYEGMHRAKKDIEELFNQKTDLYKPYIDIIDARWDKMLRKGLHSAAYWLNPIFQYDEDNIIHKREAFGGVLDMIEQSSEDSIKLTSQLHKFRDRDGSFGRPLSFSSLKSTRPDEWWKLFGGDAPELQKFAIRILSQTASSFGCERNWSVFEKIHTKKRIRLEHQRLTDIVYVYYNLRLQNRLKNDKRFYDPLDYENIDKTEFWVVDEEAKGELDYDELEKMLDEEPSNNHEPSKPQT